MDLTWSVFIGAGFVALLCQYMGVSMGVGYGTVLSPLLLIIGFSPLQVVPAVLLSQLLGGVIGGLAHHRAGNIQSDFWRDDKLIKEKLRGLGYLPRSLNSKTILVLATWVGSIIAAPFATLTVRRANAEKLRVAIGVAIIALGALTLMRTFAFWRR